MKNKLMISTLIFITACSSPQRKNSSTKKILLTGSGSSFILPMSSKIIKDYQQSHPVKINYTSGNSFKGIQDLIDNKVDFAFSSIFLSDQQIKQHPDILHIPIGAAGINFAYNVPGNEFSLNASPIYITPEILVKIINRTITRWNDPAIVSLNSQVSEDRTRSFPDLPITFISRSTSSGDTELLTRFLTKATPSWKYGITNQLPKLDEYLYGDTTLDMMKIVAQTPGALTYTTMIYGVQNNIPLLRIRNFLGVYGRGCNFRTLEAMKVAQTNKDNRVDLTYPKEGPESGVATGFMYILVKKDQNYSDRTQEQAQSLVDFIDWILSPSAQRELEPLFFAALTPQFRHSARTMLSNINYDGVQILPSSINSK